MHFHSSLLIKNPFFFCVSEVSSFPFASHNEFVLSTFDIAGNVFQLQSKAILLLEAKRQFKLLSNGFIRSLVCLFQSGICYSSLEQVELLPSRKI